MQPIKITLKGDFYDCQIYRGRLYLWTFDGALKVYDWNELVQSFIKKETDRIAMTTTRLKLFLLHVLRRPQIQSTYLCLDHVTSMVPHLLH